ncbi:hypothetical protein QCD60_30200 [Pokkaliibacter sp. MBI-7]|uniref:hypothetical protein n=1 Tax=Pokkaliibacter sp. MBI-7 TaxID=3040600 RepID=UPI00244889B6|nr:hypothetical protein [Pokkaliibacter sp. MBI-7]MDH2430993.1 hypothetical protein [Pokkaliibacter sp. MBI-7]MDH2436788.1 hypothetical protein [Pokkaliibacter sp. MBI-7]
MAIPMSISERLNSADNVALTAPHLHPGVKKVLLGTYTVPPLAEHETYCCDRGCGECEKTLLEEHRATITSRAGIVQERHFSYMEVSACCYARLGIWNEATATGEECDYHFTAATEQ